MIRVIFMIEMILFKVKIYLIPKSYESYKSSKSQFRQMNCNSLNYDFDDYFDFYDFKKSVLSKFL